MLRDYWSGLDGWGRTGAVARNILGHPATFFRTVKREKRATRGARRFSDIAIDRCFRSRHPSLRFVWACEESEEYRFHVAPGCVRVLSLAEGTEAAHQVPHSTPAHFEIGAAGDAYLSCHNFLMWDGRRYLIEPAALLRLGLNGAVPELRGVFQHPTGFRFASHAVVPARGHEYVATIGHPNRLLLVDGESMKLAAFKDIGRDCLSSRTDLPFFLSRTNLEDEALRALASSEDGRYLAVAGNDTVFIVDAGSLDVVDALPVSAPACRLAGREPGQVVNDATHCQRLREAKRPAGPGARGRPEKTLICLAGVGTVHHRCSGPYESRETDMERPVKESPKEVYVQPTLEKCESLAEVTEGFPPSLSAGGTQPM